MPVIPLLSIALLTATPAVAEEPAVSDRPGENGIKVGDGRLHVEGTADVHYVTNPGRLPPDNDLSKNGDVALMAGPRFELKMPSDTLAIDFSGEAIYRGYLNLSPISQGFSSFAGAGDLRIKINEKGSYSVLFTENFVRSADPATPAVNQTLDHNANTAGINVVAEPGGGALVFDVGYSFFFDFYDRTNNGHPDPEELDNLRHRPRLKVEWKFLPKTSVYLDGGAQFTSYPNSDGTPATGALSNDPALDFDASLGAQGYITTRISAVLQAGVGMAKIREWRNPDFVARVEIGYDFSETNKMKLAYSRSITPVSFYGVATSDRLQGRFESYLGSVARVAAAAGYNHAAYGQPKTSPDQGSGGNDNTIDATLSVDFQVLSFLSLTVGEQFTLQLSDRPPGTTNGADPGYLRNDAYVRITGRY